VPRSQTRPGVEYSVTLSDDRSWTCTCPNYTYRRTECKHILKVREEFSAPEACYVEHPMVRGYRGVPEEDSRKGSRGQHARGPPDGLVKTVIAELVAAELLHRYLGCRVLMMAPTKPLALQHREPMLRHLKLERHRVVAKAKESSPRTSILKYAWTFESSSQRSAKNALTYLFHARPTASPHR
jgi:hypothetical protein